MSDDSNVADDTRTIMRMVGWTEGAVKTRSQLSNAEEKVQRLPRPDARKILGKQCGRPALLYTCAACTVGAWLQSVRYNDWSDVTNATNACHS